jgi:hypothetical protein
MGVRTRDLALVYLSTEEAGRQAPHAHVAIFDENGDGMTTAVEGHSHDIRELEIQPAADGHTHTLGTTRVEPVSYRLYFGLICRPS